MNERAIFEAALEIEDLDRRRTYLDQVCSDVPELRAQVDLLLSLHDSAGSFLNIPAVNQLQSETCRPAAGATDCSRHSQNPALDFLGPSSKPGSIGSLAHYEVLEVLGTGSFGIVLKAFDEKLHRVVAIKVMSPLLAVTSPPRKRFLREARAAAAIRNENVVHVYSVDEQPLPYLVMEYVAGQTLQHALDASGPLGVAEILHIGRQIANGLSAAHAMGLVHRDIKPGNILLEQGAEQRVKITDFGLACAADDACTTRTRTIAGTPLYMAPEQATGTSFDQRADLFSLGSVLYVMASGRPPFRAANPIAVLKRVAEEMPRPIREIVPETPEWLCNIIARLHAKKPEMRFQSAKEVADLLARCQSELQSSRQASFPETLTLETRSAIGAPDRPRTVEPRDRNSWRTIISATACVLLMSLALAWAGTMVQSKWGTVDSRKQQREPIDAHRESPPTAAKRQPLSPTTDGYIPLFNGKDLPNWDRKGNPNAVWRVEQGVLVGTWKADSDFSGGSTLYTQRRDYQNFCFRVEMRLCEKWASSMRFLWADAGKRGGFCRAVIGTTAGRDTGLTAQLRRSWAAEPLAIPQTPVQLRSDEWFTQEVVVRGKSVQVYVNNILRTEFEFHDVPKPGHLGLELSGDSTIRIRRIDVKELPAAEVRTAHENVDTAAREIRLPDSARQYAFRLHQQVLSE